MAVILGLNAYHGDSSAALVVDGKLVAAVEEERFRRIKHWAGFPSMSIEYCLAEAGVALGDVTHVAINSDPSAHMGQKIAFALKSVLTSPRSLRVSSGGVNESPSKTSSRSTLSRNSTRVLNGLNTTSLTWPQLTMLVLLNERWPFLLTDLAIFPVPLGGLPPTEISKFWAGSLSPFAGLFLPGDDSIHRVSLLWR